MNKKQRNFKRKKWFSLVFGFQNKYFSKNYTSDLLCHNYTSELLHVFNFIYTYYMIYFENKSYKQRTAKF